MASSQNLAASSLLSPQTVAELVRQSETVYTSHADVENDHKKWCKDRKLQNRHPLGKGTRLNALFEIPVKERPSTQAPSSVRQPLPLIGGAAGESRVGTFVARLTLDQRLITPRFGRPDMWIANLVDVGRKGSAQRVVLKIAQESSHEFPQRYRAPNGNLSEMKIRHPINLIASEFFIYEKLRHLQGGLLPYSYGIYKMKMLNNEDVYIFMTEYIEGRNLAAWKADNFHPEDSVPVPPALTNYFEKGTKMIPLLKDGLAMLHTGGQGILCEGLDHCPNHVILVEDSDSEVTGVVFVEFELSSVLDNGVDESSRMDFETMSLLSHVVSCCPTHGRMFGKWMQAEKMVIPNHLFVGVDLSD